MSLVGASLEVLIEHADQHPCDAEQISVPCPCGGAVALICVCCKLPVFLVLIVDEPCEHALALAESSAIAFDQLQQ
jgi:hypothetical protein